MNRACGMDRRPSRQGDRQPRARHRRHHQSGGFTAGRKNYMAELVCERLTGEPAPKYVSAAMANGTECETEARAAYAFAADVDVVEVGFITHPGIAMAGCSPDGLVGADGLGRDQMPEHRNPSSIRC